MASSGVTGPLQVTIWRFFIGDSTFVNRISFLVDGFNLYHSARNVSKDKGLGGKGTKWLDIYSLTSSYLHLLGRDARLEEVYYFSALAKH